ncbi:hypothetical protein LINGRAPRIM_LOCUS871 [Linum grandiflorum]
MSWREARLRLPRRCYLRDPPGPHSLQNHQEHPPPPQARRRLRRRGLRALLWPRGSLHRHFWPRSHQPRQRHHRRHARQRPSRCHNRKSPLPHDRYRRVPGNSDRRDHEIDHQAQLPRRQRRPNP